MFGLFEETEDDKRLREDVVRYYRPSMRVISSGFGSWCLTMSPEDGRRTAKITHHPFFFAQLLIEQ